MPWQQDEADVALEYDPVTGLYRYDEIDTTVPRQSGKTTLTLAKKVHRMTVVARRLGPQTTTYVAQTRLKARNKLERQFSNALRSSRSFREITNPKGRPSKATEWRMSLNNGSEHIQFGSGSYLQIDAPSRTGGHGDTLDDGDIDEAFSQVDDTVEAAMRPAMATRENAQLWVTSTAGDVKSAYLYRKVLAGRHATETEAHGRVCYIEYSAPDDADPGDPETWRACMPALGHTINEAFIQGEWERAQRKGPDGIKTFRRAYLNQWPDIPILDDEKASSPFVIGWAQCVDPASTFPGRPVVAVDVTPSRSASSIAVAGVRPVDGKTHGEVIKNAAGTAWVLEALRTLRERFGVRSVTLDPGGPAGSLRQDIEAAGFTVDTVTTREYGQSCGDLWDAVVQGTFAHLGQPELDAAVRAAKKRTLGDAWAWDRKDGTDISSLVAVTLARWRTVTPTAGRFVSF